MQRTIRQIAEDHKGNLWMATQSGRIIKWDAMAGSKNIDNGFSIAQELNHIIHRLYIDKQDNLWVCTLETGLYKINTSTGQVVDHYTYRPGSERLRGAEPGTNGKNNDSETSIRPVSALLAKTRSQDRAATKSRHVLDARGRRAS